MVVVKALLNRFFVANKIAILTTAYIGFENQNILWDFLVATFIKKVIFGINSILWDCLKLLAFKIC